MIRRSPIARLLLWALLAAVVVAWAAPLAWMLATSLQGEAQALSGESGLLPRVPGRAPTEAAWWREAFATARGNYAEAWTSPVADFPLWLRNSLLVAIPATVGMTLSSAVVAFGFARLRWPGRDLLFVVVLATMMIPLPVIVVPQYLLFRSFGWVGTFLPLWVPAWFGGAFSIFLLRQFYRTIPRSLDEAAMLDGCSRLGVFLRVTLPLARPALVVVALFQLIASWNDFVGPLVYLNHADRYTLSLGLYLYQDQHSGTPWSVLMAASVMVVLPVLLLFLLAQRTFMAGIATGGRKG